VVGLVVYFVYGGCVGHFDILFLVVRLWKRWVALRWLKVVIGLGLNGSNNPNNDDIMALEIIDEAGPEGHRTSEEDSCLEY